MDSVPLESSGESLPLTRSQSLILAGQLLQPNEPLYNMVLTFRISGRVDHRQFQSAFQTLVHCGDALRTVFADLEQAPCQRVLTRFVYAVKLVDLCAEPDGEKALENWVEEHSRKQFDLKHCLFESVLLKLADNDYVWYLNQHHLLTDAWSVGVIFDKLQELYALAGADRLNAAQPLPQFRDYVLKESLQTVTPQIEKARIYWREKLATPFYPSNFYRPAPLRATGRTRRYPCNLGQERSSRLIRLVEKNEFLAFTRDLSLMQVFATLLFAYLYRVTGNSELSIGTPTHSRTSAALKATVGLLIEVFPLKITVAEGESFRSLYDKVATANQELLVHALPGAAEVEHQHGFDVLLNFIPAAFGDFDSLPATSEWVHAGYGDLNHLLRLQVHNFDQTNEFTLYFDLNEAAFVGPEREWVGHHFLLLLDAMLDDAEAEIAAPPLLVAGETPVIQAQIDDSPDGVEISSTVVELFIEQCDKCPEATALYCAGQTMSYGALNERSSQLAAYLADRGLAQGAVVAISMRRSIEAVVAVLGVMKAGCAFLPIDPVHPPARIAFVLADANAALLLALAESDAANMELAVPLCRLDSEWEHIASASPIAESTLPGLSDNAYLIYTSGSTGQPKGVLVAHASLSNYITWARDYYLGDEQLDFPLFSSLSFDLTITSLLVPLVSGGQLIVYPESDDSSVITIREVIEDNRVSVIKLTPSHLSLIQAMDFSRSRLRKLIVGGEDFKTDSAQTLTRYFDGRIQIFNEYGPTEATVACTVHRYDPVSDTGSSVPIGKPISNARIYILDAHLNRVPQGVVGEIFIAGAGVARGYLNRDELTAERFTDSPFHCGQKLYRTGDLALWNSLAQIEHLGRNDQQLKIRGVRIETQEIEAALLAVESVTEAVVDTALHFPTGGTNPEEQHCTRCGLSGKHPSAQLDEALVCRICRSYAEQAEQAQAYFRTLNDLELLIHRIRAQAVSAQNCIMLLSGGKDSSYALCRLVDLGLTPLVFTLDNGYISDDARANIHRLVDRLGLELVVGETPAMKLIFADSLSRHSNVCNGCFKTIYTLSMNLARERGIRCICTGLSRGQIFESRVAHLFQQGIFAADEVDQSVIEARKIYHRTEDIIARTLDVEIFQEDQLFHEIEYLDFYRYADVTLAEMLDYLGSKVPWVRPADTGRSTNCLINDVGIYVHKLERGYHNYALPYSWDVRLGHKERDAALAELDDEIDPQKVEKILDEIGYQPGGNKGIGRGGDYLVAYYVAGENIAEALLREQLSRVLPQEYIPRHFVRLAQLPLTANGKLDRESLPRPGSSEGKISTGYVAPANDTEALLARLWSQMLDIDDVGVNDNFFDLGGDSIIIIQIVAAAREQGIEITPQQTFDFPSVRALAAQAGSAVLVTADQGLILGEVPLLPSQRRFFESERAEIHAFSQSVVLEYQGHLDPNLLEQALQRLLVHHDGLRSRFSSSDNGWRQEVLGPEQVVPLFSPIDISGVAPGAMDHAIESETRRLYDSLDVETGRLLAVSQLDAAQRESGFLVIVLHHLVVDGVSWWILLEDLECAYRQLANQQPVRLPKKTSSIRQWALALEAYSRTRTVHEELSYWLQQSSSGGAALTPQVQNPEIPRASSAVCSVSLDQLETSALVHEVPGQYGVQVSEVLLTALLRTVLPWSGDVALRLDVEGHGREDSIGPVDLMRSIAWFTSLYPLCLRPGDSGDAGEDLKRVKEQLRTVPGRGVGYGLLRYPMHETAGNSVLAGLPSAQVLFNYMGQWGRTLAADSRFRFVGPIRAYHGTRGRRSHPWEINAMVFDEQLHIDWSYNPELHDQALIERLAQQFICALGELISYCITTDESSLTPSDFPAVELSQGELDDLLAEFGEAGSRGDD